MKDQITKYTGSTKITVNEEYQKQSINALRARFTLAELRRRGQFIKVVEIEPEIYRHSSGFGNVKDVMTGNETITITLRAGKVPRKQK